MRKNKIQTSTCRSSKLAAQFQLSHRRILILSLTSWGMKPMEISNRTASANSPQKNMLHRVRRAVIDSLVVTGKTNQKLSPDRLK
jgi:hypothetical protein